MEWESSGGTSVAMEEHPVPAGSSLCCFPRSSHDRPQGGLSSVKNTILLKEITSDIRNGIPDEELMKKYGLSEKGLKRVFESLLKATCNGSRHIEVESDG